MKTFLHLWQYLAKFWLEREMFLTKVVEKIKTLILCWAPFFRKSCRLRDNVEKYGGDRGAANDVTTWRMRNACWISKATHARACTRPRARLPTHPPATHKYIILIAFPRQQWFANAPQCYVIVYCVSYFKEVLALGLKYEYKSFL